MVEAVRDHFGTLLARHLAQGTRPDGKPGEPWTYARFARSVASSREKDDPNVSERTVSNWCKGKSIPEEVAPILRALFGADTQLNESSRKELRGAFILARQAKAAATMRRQKPDKAGGVWVEDLLTQQVVLDEQAGPRDAKAAQDPLHNQLQTAIFDMATELAADAERLSNTRLWGRLASTAARFRDAVSGEPSQVLGRLGTAYPSLLRLGGFLESDIRVQKDHAASDEPLDHDLHALLTTLVRTAAPWLRGFPLVAKWDDDAGRALLRPELFQPAQDFARVAFEQGAISEPDKDKLDFLSETAAIDGEFQQHKAKNRVIGSVGNLMLKLATITASFLVGAVASDFSTKSDLVKKAGSTLEKAAQEVERFAETRPKDLQLAYQAIIRDWRQATEMGDARVGTIEAEVKARDGDDAPSAIGWPAKPTPPPAWAKQIGTDVFGTYADIAIPTGKSRLVRQRMRLIQPGRFHMGSPRGEPGRYDDEGPKHEVAIQQGFWLFDTPCTQQLWRAVMGKNPSAFNSPTRPVERVRYTDVLAFLDTANGRVEGLDLILPSEAQWEYACRAGTGDATYAGPMEILGEHNAPVLDAIAWYGGNSGQNFDLKNGYDSSDWKDQQYPNTRAGTRIVKQKDPNRWGLYDMLGNVWEWCADEWHGTYDGAPNDGTAWAAARDGAADRVIRGGSWGNGARDVRSAVRYHADPSLRNDGVGFRCARVHEQA